MHSYNKDKEIMGEIKKRKKIKKEIKKQLQLDTYKQTGFFWHLTMSECERKPFYGWGPAWIETHACQAKKSLDPVGITLIWWLSHEAINLVPTKWAKFWGTAP